MTLFDHPEGQHAIAFSDRDRRIEFATRWETLPTSFDKLDEESFPWHTESLGSAPPANGPTAFLSYASRDADAVNELARKLQSSGIVAWAR